MSRQSNGAPRGAVLRLVGTNHLRAVGKGEYCPVLVLAPACALTDTGLGIILRYPCASRE